jgi:Ca2+-binding RTX toxin-like protein
MGVGYDQPVVQWSKGEYTNPTNTEDDYAVMAGTGLMEMDDDHTNSTGTATPLASTMTGVISSEADYDAFRYLAPSNATATFTAVPAPVSPNLDILFRVYASDGVTLLAESRPTVARVGDDVATGLDASISLSVTKGSVYYIQVSGDSFQTPADGYSKYGSIGQYTVTASPVAVVCNGWAATIVGTPGADDLLGTTGKDVISGLGGNDTITSLGGNDTICGGGGMDTLNGRDGADTLIGGGGADVIRGGPGSDELNGGSGNDDLFGQGGNDEFRGGSGSDLCSGGPGIDDIVSGCETIKAVP